MFYYMDNVSIDGAIIDGKPFVRLRMPPDADWMLPSDMLDLARRLEETAEQMNRLAAGQNSLEKAINPYDRLDFDPVKVSPDLLDTLRSILNPPDESA